ncbi:ABC transporter ATP-binding protein [Halostagnicola bangensis]
MSETTDGDLDLTWREKGQALYRVAKFQPFFAAGVIVLAVIAALLEGIGLSFLMPIVEVAQGETAAENADGILGAFFTVYEFLGIDFTLGYLVAGVALIMTVRFTTSFLVGWFRAAIETKYVRHLQEESFTHALDAEIAYFDEEGSDDILNAIVTQAEYAGQVIRYTINVIEQGLLALMYLSIAMILSPSLTILTMVLLGGATFLFRSVLETGYSLGDQVADAKEGIQSSAQAGTQGIREVKLFGMTEELKQEFSRSAERFETNRIKVERNDAAITNFYQLATAVTVFVLIYLALTFSAMNLAELGVFLFAMFQLGPKVSNLNKYVYRVESELPHLVRTQEFIDELVQNSEPNKESVATPSPIKHTHFNNVYFSYGEENENTLQNISFKFDEGDFVAFVGPSGAGKSTIASLLARMYEPDHGEITANGIPIQNLDIREWRSRVTVVRQEPHIFNDTLLQNITIGNQNATKVEIIEACDIAQVTEFLDDLPNSYDTVLGDQGVKLSGGQRQRVAIARALLKDADLLILDEATSDLDTSLEKKVHEGIETMDREYAMLVIAHRLSTVTNADRIYTMEEGNIVESGSHKRLVSREGKYSELYSLQSTHSE